MSKCAIVYWSGTGNTEAMANCIADGVREAGAEAVLLGPSDFSTDRLAEFDTVAFGCPAMGAEVLELQVLCSNAAAIHVYEKLGFSIAGTYRKFFRYGPGEYADAYWMNLYL